MIFLFLPGSSRGSYFRLLIFGSHIFSLYPDSHEFIWLLMIVFMLISRKHFFCFSKTWKFRKGQSFQKPSWKIWREKRRRYETQNQNLGAYLSLMNVFVCSWNTETELQNEERNTASLNLPHRNGNSIKFQLQLCKPEVGVVYPDLLAQVVYPDFSDQQKLWTAHKRRFDQR